MGNMCGCLDGPVATTTMPPPATTTTVTRSMYAAPQAPQNYTYAPQPPMNDYKPVGPLPVAQPHQIVLPDGRVAVLGSDGRYYPLAQGQQQQPMAPNQVVETTHTTTTNTTVVNSAPAQADVGLGTAMLAGTAGFLGGMMLGSAMEQPSSTVIVEEPPMYIDEGPTIIEETVVIEDDDDW
ncbi:hypothetical protein Pmar_PMAR020619 [Perkinsus marinus ATCC 50983]|uniref:Uncharacterized protein n=1 Tax=Perkinsus marinus (strain ATCC 50983 / TXsc) TaxID=423536 RepID=C5L7J5_PERM5|nr:hypothetical protein Pmar_PMAR020619 [Perkinsus marinus ATCC 50983]EER07457.1 hypothetical protein Pmar_PMAR020619 [Perkinsus marinus ATCC 50983]|eukprot:XP_002775641.1 hypothetical protein Pmar_PMAR020619 [Perkinsus marinus ATCC 50983]